MCRRGEYQAHTIDSTSYAIWVHSTVQLGGSLVYGVYLVHGLQSEVQRASKFNALCVYVLNYSLPPDTDLK